MSEHSYKTAAGREAARREIDEKIAELTKKLEPEQVKQDKLISENKSKIDARTALNQQMDSKKSTGKTIRKVGIFAIIIGAIAAVALQKIGLGIAIAVVGVVALVLGAVISNGSKKFLPDIEKLNNELSKFDQENSALSEIIDDYEYDIRSLEKELNEIALAEKYEKVNNWIDSISTGHVVLYASSENHLFEPTHRDPKPIMYDSLTLTSAECYVNDMLYGTVHAKYKERNIDIFEIDETGTQKTEFLVNYHIGDVHNNYQTAPMPVKFDQKSLFCWFHVSTCQKGTHVFAQSYHTFDAFLEETGITKDELIKRFL